jgi:transposase-like protein
MAPREIKRYSLTFKRQVVREYEAGASVPSLMRKYGITGNQTIRNWIKIHSEKGSRIAMTEITDPRAQYKNRIMAMNIG